MTKALGTEIKDFYFNGWPYGYYHDDTEIEFHDQNTGEWVLPLDEEFDLEKCGWLFSDKTNQSEIAFVDAFLKWNGTPKNKDKIIVIHVPENKVEIIKQFLFSNGIKIKDIK